MRLAEIGIFELVWSDYLLDEIERVLVERKRLPQSAAEYFCDCIRDSQIVGRDASIRVRSQRLSPVLLREPGETAGNCIRQGPIPPATRRYPMRRSALVSVGRELSITRTRIPVASRRMKRS